MPPQLKDYEIEDLLTPSLIRLKAGWAKIFSDLEERILSIPFDFHRCYRCLRLIHQSLEQAPFGSPPSNQFLVQGQKRFSLTRIILLTTVTKELINIADTFTYSQCETILKQFDILGGYLLFPNEDIGEDLIQAYTSFLRSRDEATSICRKRKDYLFLTVPPPPYPARSVFLGRKKPDSIIQEEQQESEEWMTKFIAIIDQWVESQSQSESEIKKNEQWLP